MVADGVGGTEGGELASATALSAASRYVVESMNCYYSADATEATFIEARCRRRPSAATAPWSNAPWRPLPCAAWPPPSRCGWGSGPGTTSSRWGDSRCYLFRDGALTQLSRDQTVAQDLVDQGVLTRASGERSQFSHVLSSAIGGPETLPVVARLRADWRNVFLGCSDGLTKHVSDERIAERLAAMTSAKQVCEQLLQDALDDGGTDNITIVVGRTIPKEKATP